MKIRGVASVIKADTPEEALAEVKLDPYYASGIWDPSTVCAFYSPFNIYKLGLPNFLPATD